MSGIKEPKIVEAMKIGLVRMLRLRKDPKSPVITIPPMMWLGAVIFLNAKIDLILQWLFSYSFFHSMKNESKNLVKKKTFLHAAPAPTFFDFPNPLCVPG